MKGNHSLNSNYSKLFKVAMNAFEKIEKFYDEIQDEVWESKSELNDLVLAFDDCQREEGLLIDPGLAILQLNFPGSSDHYYCVLIPRAEMAMDRFKAYVDELPVYFIDYECTEISESAYNFKGFIAHHLKDPRDPRLAQFSDKSRHCNLHISTSPI